jgi:hypothetical protein
MYNADNEMYVCEIIATGKTVLAVYYGNMYNIFVPSTVGDCRQVCTDFACKIMFNGCLA